MNYRNCGLILDRIGKGPVVEICHVNHTKCKILAKMESFNPSGSIKDVMALYMISKAENKGEIKPGGKIIEVTADAVKVKTSGSELVLPLKKIERATQALPW